MDVDAKDLLLYLIDKHECGHCKFTDTCDELQNKGKHCLCDVAYKDLNKR